MKDNIKGEETPYFQTASGHRARIHVCDTEEETRQLLELALSPHEDDKESEKLRRHAASVLASIIHACVSVPAP